MRTIVDFLVGHFVAIFMASMVVRFKLLQEWHVVVLALAAIALAVLWSSLRSFYDNSTFRMTINGKRVIGGLALLLLFTAPAFAARPCYVVRQQVVAHHQAYVAPVAINYFVGQPIRAEAIVEKALRNDPDYEAFKKFKLWRNTSDGRPAIESPPDTAQRTPDTSQVAADIPDNVIPILYKHCGGCHSGAAPKAGLLLDGSAYIDCKTLVKCIDEISTGSMPKAKPNQAKPELSDADEDAVIAALGRLVKESP
jgi:hypothetical protein